MLSALVLVLGAYDVVVQPSPGEKPHLDWEKPVWCVTLRPTAAVPSGEFRVQCDAVTQTCLAAPTRVLVDGVEGEEPLSRVSEGCGGYLDELVSMALHSTGGWPTHEAIAEAPPGWFRDERGRVMQVNFDLQRRVFFGGAWAPYYRPDGTGFVPGRARVELGGVATLNRRDRQQHRFHLLEASVWLGADARDTRLEASVLRYDTSIRHERPLLWLTTFVGKPRRIDLPLNVGWAAEAGRFEALGGRTFITVLELDATVDLWTAPDLDSYLRVRFGPALEYDAEGKGAYLRPAVAVEGDFTLDRDGFHHLTASVLGEKLFFEPTDPGRGPSPQRIKVKAGYELILFALNDYPVTLSLEGRATWRDDVPLLKGWEFSGNAGLRFSLWAPGRHVVASARRAPRLVPSPAPAPAPANPPLPEEAPAEQPSES